MSGGRSARWYRRLLALFPAEFRADFGDSMRADFADEAREAQRRGLTAVVALWLRTIAGILRVSPREHAARLTQDARYGIRLAGRRPVPALAAAVVLGLGIAALTSTFAVVDAFILRPLPFAAADRLVHVWTTERTAEEVTTRSSWPDLQAWSLAAGVDGLAAFNYTEEDLIAGAQPERLHAARVSAELFEVLGAAPAHGRTFRPGEDRAGAAPVAVVSTGFAERRFGRPAAAVGRTMRVGEVTHEIVGVMPRAFVFPLPITEAWLPYAFAPATYPRSRQSLQVVARLAAGVPAATAAAELDTIARAQSQAHGDRVSRGAAIEPLREALNFADEFFRLGGPILLLAATLILLVACANVSSVLLGQALARGREAGVRAALGASRLRLVRQFAFEQTALVAAATALGVLLAHVSLRGTAAAIPPDLYRVGELAIDVRALAVAVIAAVAAVAIAAVAPALRLGRADATAALRGGRAQTEAPRTLRLQHGLIGLQVCASVALVAATFAAWQALDALATRPLGFDRHGVLTMKFILSPGRYATGEAVAGFHTAAADRLRHLPGVTAAATVNHLPLNHEAARITYEAASAAPAPAASRSSTFRVIVSPGYFTAMGIALQSGRDFDVRDTADGVPVAVINAALAERIWPGERPLGRRLRVGESGAEVEIAGVVGNARHFELAGPDELVLYRPVAQVPVRYARVVVRTAGDPAALSAAAQRRVWDVDAALPLTEVRTLDEVVREFLLPQRALGVTMATLGAAALAVASTGLYGLLSLLVTQRQQEIGIRLALGAGTAAVVRAIAWRVTATVAAALVVGLGLSRLLTQGLAAVLPGAAAAPGVVFMTVTVLLVVTTAAAIVPVRRAARVDPMSVLRA